MAAEENSDEDETHHQLRQRWPPPGQPQLPQDALAQFQCEQSSTRGVVRNTMTGRTLAAGGYESAATTGQHRTVAAAQSQQTAAAAAAEQLRTPTARLAGKIRSEGREFRHSTASTDSTLLSYELTSAATIRVRHRDPTASSSRHQRVAVFSNPAEQLRSSAAVSQATRPSRQRTQTHVAPNTHSSPHATANSGHTNKDSSDFHPPMAPPLHPRVASGGSYGIARTFLAPIVSPVVEDPVDGSSPSSSQASTLPSSRPVPLLRSSGSSSASSSRGGRLSSAGSSSLVGGSSGSNQLHVQTVLYPPVSALLDSSASTPASTFHSMPSTASMSEYDASPLAGMARSRKPHMPGSFRLGGALASAEVLGGHSVHTTPTATAARAIEPCETQRSSSSSTSSLRAERCVEGHRPRRRSRHHDEKDLFVSRSEIHNDPLDGHQNSSASQRLDRVQTPLWLSGSPKSEASTANRGTVGGARHE